MTRPTQMKARRDRENVRGHGSGATMLTYRPEKGIARLRKQDPPPEWAADSFRASLTPSRYFLPARACCPPAAPRRYSHAPGSL